MIMDTDLKRAFWALTDYMRDLQENSISLPRFFEVLELAIQLKLREGYELQYIEDFNDDNVFSGFWQGSMEYYSEDPLKDKPEICFIINREALGILYGSDVETEELCRFLAGQPASITEVFSKLQEAIPLYQASRLARREVFLRDN